MAGDLIPWQAENREDELTPTSIVTSYDLADRASKIAVFRAMQRSDKALDDIVGEIINVQHIVRHVVSLVGKETGERYDAIRTVLIAPDGTRYGTTSNTVASDIRRAAALLDQPMPFDPPLTFRVVKVPSRNSGMKYLTLELLA